MAFDLGVKVLEWDQFSHFVKTHYILEMFSTPTHIACSFIINEKKVSICFGNPFHSCLNSILHLLYML